MVDTGCLADRIIETIFWLRMISIGMVRPQIGLYRISTQQLVDEAKHYCLLHHPKIRFRTDIFLA